PAGSPPYTDKRAAADPVLQADSSFTIMAGAPVALKKEGLYLLQQDTTSAKGVAFRIVPPSYPKTTRMKDLADPMIFLCTREEFEKLTAAGEDKTKFDKVILGITRDKERAKNIMRNYFRNVEQANLYFTSYKEGWKTDRGMIHMIFGLPDEVNMANKTEIWYY